MTTEQTNSLIIAGVGLAGTILGAVIGGVATYLATRSSNKVQQQLAKQAVCAQQRATLDGLVIRMLEFAIEHPTLEKLKFCHSYPACSGHENGKERYESYCCFVFNLLMMIFKHFDGKPEQIEAYIGVDEIVFHHHKWWDHDRENLNYDAPFRAYIQTVIDRLKKEGKM